MLVYKFVQEEGRLESNEQCFSFSLSNMTKRKIIVYIATSADGFIARKDGGIDWLDRPRPKGDYGMGEFYKSVDTILFGRKTYDVALKFQAEGIEAPEMPGIRN